MKQSNPIGAICSWVENCVQLWRKVVEKGNLPYTHKNYYFKAYEHKYTGYGFVWGKSNPEDEHSLPRYSSINTSQKIFLEMNGGRKFIILFKVTYVIQVTYCDLFHLSSCINIRTFFASSFYNNGYLDQMWCLSFIGEYLLWNLRPAYPRAVKTVNTCPNLKSSLSTRKTKRMLTRNGDVSKKLMADRSGLQALG